MYLCPKDFYKKREETKVILEAKKIVKDANQIPVHICF